MSDEREGEKPFRITVTNEMMAAVRAHREAREKLTTNLAYSPEYNAAISRWTTESHHIANLVIAAIENQEQKHGQ